LNKFGFIKFISF